MKDKKRLIVLAIFGLLVVGGALFVVAKKGGLTISKTEENLVVEEGTGDFPEGDAKTTIEEIDGLPKDFPEDFPLYPQAEIKDSFTTKGETAEAQSVIWGVDGTIEEVSGFYQTELSHKGWEIDLTVDENESVIISFKKDRLNGFAGIGKSEEGEVIISVTIGTSYEEPSL